MQSVTVSKYKPSGKFSLPGMLLTLMAGIGTAVIAGLVFYLVGSVIPCGIPFLFPVLLGIAVGIVTMELGSRVGRCRNQVLAISIAVIAGIVAGSSEHIIDYARFRLNVFNSIATEAPQASLQSINSVIDQWLRDETGHPGFIGFMLLKTTSDSIEIIPLYYGAAIGGFRLTGPFLVLYWLFELLTVTGLAGFMNRSYSLEPYCEQCNAWRKCKVPVVGSVDRIDEAVEALQRREITAAVRALGTHSEGDIARLEMELCPVCYDNSHTTLVVVRDAGEYTVWTDKLDTSSVRGLLELAQ